MKLKTFRLNGVTYTIKEKEYFEIEGAFGHFRNLTQIIDINAGLRADGKATTLLHEMLHAIANEYLSSKEDLSETQVTALTNGLINLFGENGIDLKKLLTEGLEIE